LVSETFIANFLTCFWAILLLRIFAFFWTKQA